MKLYYIAYGSNLNLADMKKRCPEAVLVGIGLLPNYRLVFKGIRDNYSYLTIEKEDNCTVPIGIFELEKNNIKQLDCYEGYPNLYHRKMMNIKLGNTLVTGLIYIMNDNYTYHLPSRTYLRTCFEGYKDFSFNSNFLAIAYQTTKKEMKKNISVKNKLL